MEERVEALKRKAKEIGALGKTLAPSYFDWLVNTKISDHEMEVILMTLEDHLAEFGDKKVKAGDRSEF